MPPRRRRRQPSNELTVGHDEGMSLWIDTLKPGLHFRVYADAELTVSGSWQVQEQGLVLTEITVTSRSRVGSSGLEELMHVQSDGPSDPRPITGSILRSISVPELERRSRAALKRGSESEEDLERSTEELRKQGLDLPALFQVPRAARDLNRRLGEASFRPGRQGYPFSLYKWVATEYLRLSRRGSRKINQELAQLATERLGRDVSTSNVRDWVHRARELQLLTPGRRGRADAEPGPALRPGIG